MGTEITLELGGIALSYAKNHRGMDHGALFQDTDRKPVRSEQIDYGYFERKGGDPTEMEMAFARQLRDIIPRLDLLGYTLDGARTAYDRWVETCRDEEHAADEPEPLSFDEFCAFACREAVEDLDDTYVDYETQQRPNAVMGRFAADETILQRIPTGFDHDDSAWSERSFFGAAIRILPPYFMLQVLAGNPKNLETEVVWQYGPLVEGGYADTEVFQPSARRTETFLIATEGSSDAHILRQALKLLRPAVLDFFRFIDVSEGHPFSGTGSLVKFAEGLAKIDIHNQILFVFDNDAEGVEACQKVSALNLPANMRAIRLPDLKAFQQFPARGPEGEHLADINGRAAAIECYLDHRLKSYPAPRVIWTNYKKELDTYQGALEHKESYAKAFMRLKPDALADYDTVRVCAVLDAAFHECVAMATASLAQRLEPADYW